MSAGFGHPAVVGDLDKSDFSEGARVEARMQWLTDEWTLRKQRWSVDGPFEKFPCEGKHRCGAITRGRCGSKESLVFKKCPFFPFPPLLSSSFPSPPLSRPFFVKKEVTELASLLKGMRQRVEGATQKSLGKVRRVGSLKGWSEIGGRPPSPL